MKQHTLVHTIQAECKRAGLSLDDWLDFDGHIARWNATADKFEMVYAQYHYMKMEFTPQQIKELEAGHKTLFFLIRSALQSYVMMLEDQVTQIRAYLKEPQ